MIYVCHMTNNQYLFYHKQIIQCLNLLKLQVICLLQGNVSSYLVKKYNFSAECKVLPFTSDCDQSLIGLGAKPGELSASITYIEFINHSISNMGFINRERRKIQ